MEHRALSGRAAAAAAGARCCGRCRPPAPAMKCRVHQARVASRRLREALPVLGGAPTPARSIAPTSACAGSPARSGRCASSTSRLLLLAEFAPQGRRCRPRAMARVRKRVVEERQRRRREMLDAITPIAAREAAQAARQGRQLAGGAGLVPRAGRVDEAARASRMPRRDARRGHRARRRHLPGRSPAPRPHRRQEAALRARDPARADGARARRRASTALEGAAGSARPHARPRDPDRSRSRGVQARCRRAIASAWPELEQADPRARRRVPRRARRLHARATGAAEAVRRRHRQPPIRRPTAA